MADNTLSGHHKNYLEELATIERTKALIIPKEFSTSKKELKYYLDRIEFIVKVLQESNIKKNSTIHFLYLDPIYAVFSLVSPFIKKKNRVMIGTIHHVPTNRLSLLLLKHLSRSMHIICHSEYLKRKLHNSGIKNVSHIDYPYFESKKLAEIEHKIMLPQKEKVVFSFLGGTRKDKGLDFFLSSLNYIDQEILQKMHILIAGKEDYYKKDYIVERLNKYSVSSTVRLEFLSDEEYEQYLSQTDVIVLPYTKGFTGNSGPMTEGVKYKKPVIGPRDSNIGYLIEQYKLGYTFSIENTRSLAYSIMEFMKYGWNPNENSKKFEKKISANSFKNKHKVLYSNLRKEEI